MSNAANDNSNDGAADKKQRHRCNHHGRARENISFAAVVLEWFFLSRAQGCSTRLLDPLVSELGPNFPGGVGL